MAFNGELAKEITDASHNGELAWTYYNTKGKEKLEMYKKRNDRRLNLKKKSGT